MSQIRSALNDALNEALAQADVDGLSETYQQQLSTFQHHALAVLDDFAAGKVTAEQAQVAAEQSLNALKSTLLAGALDARAKAQEFGLKLIGAILKAALAVG